RAVAAATASRRTAASPATAARSRSNRPRPTSSLPTRTGTPTTSSARRRAAIASSMTVSMRTDAMWPFAPLRAVEVGIGSFEDIAGSPSASVARPLVAMLALAVFAAAAQAADGDPDPTFDEDGRAWHIWPASFAQAETTAVAALRD